MPVKKGKEKLGGVWINLETVIIFRMCISFLLISKQRDWEKLRIVNMFLCSCIKPYIIISMFFNLKAN